MIELLSQISTQNTVAVEVKCLVNQSVIDKNFRVIIDCLKDLENKQNKMQTQMKEIIDKNNNIQKQLETAKTNTSIRGIISEENIRTEEQEDKVSNHSQEKQKRQLSNEEEIRQLIRDLQEQLNKDSELNKKNNLENIKDINILLKDVKELKEKVEGLENANKSNELNKQEVDANNSNQPELTQQSIRILQNQLHKHSQKLDKLQSEVDKVKNKNSNILQKLKGIEAGSGGLPTSPQVNIDEDGENSLGQLRSDLDKLTQKVNNNEVKQREDTRELAKRWQNADINLKQLNDKNSINEANIQDIFNRFDSLGNNNNNNSDSIGEKDRYKLQKDMKKLEDMIKKQNNKNDEWRRRIDENIKQHTLNISDLLAQISNLQNMIANLQREKLNSSSKDLIEGQKNIGQRLPSISGKKGGLRLKNSREESSHKNLNDIDNKLQQFKSDLQNWVRQLLDTRNIGGQDSNSKKKDQFIDGIQLKIQQIKLILERKADEQGVKKYLSFLDNKINQIWAIISQPDTQDALIARKGWNCLSCAKKLQKYRGRIGQHLNWNNMTTTNYSPPKINQTVSYNNTAQNFNNPISKNRQYGNEQDSKSKQFP